MEIELDKRNYEEIENILKLKTKLEEYLDD